MISSVEKILEEGEEVEETLNPSMFDTRYFAKYVASIIGVLLVSLSVVYIENNFELPIRGVYLSTLAAIPIIYGVVTEIQRRFQMYHITDRKIIMEKGVLDKQWKSLYYTDITHVEMIQNFEERIFGVSDLYIDTAGEGGTELTLNGIEKPHEYQKLIMERMKSGE